MSKQPESSAVIQADFAPPAAGTPAAPAFIEHEMTDALHDVVTEIDQIFGDVQVASLTAFWRVGKLISDVKNNPDQYLTAEQRSAHVDGASFIFSIFAPVYTAEQLRGAVMFFERYPAEQEIVRLLSLRCPDRPRWRMTVSHVQLLAQVSDDTKRTVLEEKCAEEAYTARSLAVELQEIRGKQKNSGRTHRAPKGLKQQLLDLLQHQRRFLARSEKLWLSEDDDNIYDDIANAPPEKLDTTIASYFAEIRENFDKMGDAVADHVAMCRKLNDEIFSAADEEPAADDDAEADTDEPAQPAQRARRSDITR